MTALSKQKTNLVVSSKTVRIPMGNGAVIHLGGMVSLSSAGVAVPSSDTNGHRGVIGRAVRADPGQAVEGTIDNSTNNKFVIVESDLVMEVAATSVAQSQVGTPMYVVDDQTVDDVAGVTNKVAAGILVEVISATKCKIYIPPYGGNTRVTAPFVSTEQTGTGASQNVAHGLGVIPSKVLVSFSELVAGLAAGADIALGAHTSTNVVLTVTTGVKFYVLALP